jgi:hypothetical protein
MLSVARGKMLEIVKTEIFRFFTMANSIPILRRACGGGGKVIPAI